MTSDEPRVGQRHFADKTPQRHIFERFSRGVAFADERHSLEPSGAIASSIDALRSAAVLGSLFVLAISCAGHSVDWLAWLLFSLGFTLWQACRASWLGWFRLERLHRELMAEQAEIISERDQERMELEALYAMKGFAPPLLEQVVEVLMSDDDRLLRVMLEEELGMSLGVHEHPLKRGLCAGSGSLVASGCLAVGLYWYGPWGAIAAGATALTAGSALAARLEGNRILEAVLWNAQVLLAIAAAICFTGDSWRGQ